MDKFLSLLINGIFSSSSILACALGMAIICGKMKLFNLAHGELIMIGAYVAYEIAGVLKLPFALSIVVSFIITFLLGMVIEKVIIKPLYSNPEDTLLATFGISMVLVVLVKLIFDSAGRSVDMPIKGSVMIGNAIVPLYNFAILGSAVAMLALTLLIFYGTPLGKQIRAIGQNRQMAECLGINTSFCDTFTFSYGCALAGVAGTMLAPLKSINPSMGTSYMLDAFMSVVVGGAESFVGTVVASLGMGESLALIGGYLDSVIAKIIVFFAIIILIRIKPEGLFSKERR
ncbi:MAG: urea ABC transporter permease subunit UrtB [Lachnospiraceae bacterium]|nr:urea ABC transporter permease subunit UrtB [Lachnospiraceae bacterium]